MQRFILFLLIIASCFLACTPKDGQGGMLEPTIVSNQSTVEKSEKADKKINKKREFRVGQPIDWLNGIPVYYNGESFHSMGRNVGRNGYNYGLKWQCVEFVKRYYHDHLNHSMPDTYGHAKHFFSFEVEDGAINWQRNLRQFKNGGVYRPKVNDIIVFEGKHFGHIAIISKVEKDKIEIVQQNVGKASRHHIKLYHSKGHYYIMHKAVLGWLGKR